MAKRDKQEFEELSIGTVTGLQAFLRNAQLLYNTGLSREEELVGEGDLEYGDLLHSAFSELRQTTTDLISNLQSGLSVSDEDAKILQRRYDELSKLVTEVRKVAKKKKQPAPPPKPEPVAKVEPKESKPKPVDKRPVKKRPKTGSINVTSDDAEVIDVKQQMKVDNQSKRAQNKSTKNKKGFTSEAAIDSGYRKSIGVVAEKSRQELATLKKKYPKPNKVQQMLFEEAKEGIEQLELVTKKSGLSKDKQASVAEIASYVKHALTGVVEAEEVEMETGAQPDRVPVVTEQADDAFLKAERNESPVSFVPTSVTGAKSKITKRPIPKRLQTLPKPDDVYERESLTDTYLTAPKYKHFIEKNYSSTANFERIIDATITDIESSTIDQIEKWLGDVPASAFGFVKEMLIFELAAFANRPHEAIVADLQRENVKYETFAQWRDLVDEMLELVEGGEKMKFGQLFVHWMAEIAMKEA